MVEPTTLPWYGIAMRTGVVADTGALLLHAFALYQQGTHLRRFSADIPPDHVEPAAALLVELFNRARVYTTPQVIAEFQALAQSRAGFDDANLGKFLLFYAEFPLEETYVEWKELAGVKSRTDSWNLSYTDTSVVVAAQRQNAPALTLDRQMRRLGRRLEVHVIHVYEDFFLHLAQP